MNLLTIANPENFSELIQNPYFSGPIIGMAGLILVYNYLQTISKRAAK